MEKERLRDFRTGERDRKGNKGRVGEKGEKARDTIDDEQPRVNEGHQLSLSAEETAREFKNFDQPICKAAPL